MLEDFGKKEIIEVIDMTSFVNEQRGNVSPERIAQLVTPIEREFIPDNPEIRNKIRLD